MSEYPDSPGDMTRRQALRRTTASADPFAGFEGGSNIELAETGYERVDEFDPAHTASAFETQASALLDGLVAEGLLDQGSVSELPTDQFVPMEGIANGTEGTGQLRGRDGKASDIVTTLRAVDDGSLQVTVHPEDDRAYAIRRSDDDGVRIYEVTDGRLTSKSDCNCVDTCIFQALIHCPDSDDMYCGYC